MRGYHDIGGLPADTVPRKEEPLLRWQVQLEAIRSALGDPARRILPLDELRRAYEHYGAGLYNGLPFYERRLEAMIFILVEKGVITLEELEARAASIRERRQAGA